MSNLSVKQKKFIKEDLAEYELRQLLGAAELVKFLDVNDGGNLSSLYRDAIYLHARNLYNFFHGVARNDASIYEFTNHVFDVSLYILWKKSLHIHVVHIKDSRSNPIPLLKGKQISDVAIDFAEDIKKLWQEWIDNSGGELKEMLLDGLNVASRQAKDDLKCIEGLNK